MKRNISSNKTNFRTERVLSPFLPYLHNLTSRKTISSSSLDGRDFPETYGNGNLTNFVYL